MHQTYKKIRYFLLLLFIALFINNFQTVQASENGTNQQFSATIQEWNKSSASAEEVKRAEYITKVLEGKGNIFVAEGGWSLATREKLVITGVLPDKDSKIKCIESSFDPFHVGEPQISYGEEGGKRTYTILYKIAEDSKESAKKYGTRPKIVGGQYFNIQVVTDDKTEDYIVVLQNKDSNLAISQFANVTGINMKDVQADVILEGETEIVDLGKGKDKYKIADLDSDLGIISFKVNRKQDELKPMGMSSTSSSWLSIGNNFLSVNGNDVQRFDVNSRQIEQSLSQNVYLKKGWNFINLYFMYGQPVGALSTGENDIFIAWPDLADSTINPWRANRNILSIPYIIYWDGEVEEPEFSNDTGIQALDPISWAKKMNDSITAYSWKWDEDENQGTVIMPKTEAYNKFILGIIPSTAGAEVNIQGVARDSICGNYYVVDLDSDVVEKISEGKYGVKVQVTAPDKVTTQEHTIVVSRQSSECKLQSINIDGATVEGLDAGLVGGENSFIMKLDADDGTISFDHIKVSENAVCSIDGKNAEGKTTVNSGDITRVWVTAQDGITKQLYIFLHEKKDGTLPYFSISDETKSLAEELLSGWNNRSEDERKNLTGDSWGVFKTLATDSRESLNGAAVYDVNKTEYKQATDYGKIILQLVMTGENPYEYVDQYGNNLVYYLQENWKGPYANSIWALMGLKAAGAELPGDLIAEVTRQAGNSKMDLDMRAWALGAVADLVSKEKLASLAEGFRVSLITKGDEAGMFYNEWYIYANVISHGCVLEGMSAAGVDVEKQFGVSGTASPLITLKKYLMEDGSFKYDKAAKEGTWAKDTIIGLGDIVHGDNVWKRYALTIEEYKNLLGIARKCYGEDGASIVDEDKRNALKSALDVASTANADDIQGLGDEYYALYTAVADIDPVLVGKPSVRVCTYEESLLVDRVISSIDLLKDLSAVTDESAKEVRSAYDALGGTDTELKEKLQGYVKNLNVLFKAESYLKFTSKVDAVGVVTENSREMIEAAEAAYADLDEELKQEQAVKEKYQVLRENRSVFEVITVIAELPSLDQLTLEDADDVDFARTSYEALNSELRAKVTNSSILMRAIGKLSDLTAIKAVEDLITALPDPVNISLELDGEAVLKAYNEYLKLTENQKTLIPVELYNKLTETYKKIKEQQSDAEAVQEVIDNIAEIPAIEKLTLEYESFVKSVRGLYESLSTDALREKVTNYETLVAAEVKLEEIKIADLVSLIDSLPKPEALEGNAEDGSDIEMTQETLSTIAEAMARYESMEDAQKQIFANEDPERHKKLMELDEIASQYEGYIDEVLAPLIRDIKSFELPVTQYNAGLAGDLVTRYQSNEEAKTYLDSIVWEEGTGLKDKMEAIEEQLAQVGQAIEEASRVDLLIEALPDTIGKDNYEEVQTALEVIQAAYDKLSETAQSYITYVDRWNEIEGKLSVYLEAAEAAEKVISLIEQATDEESNDLLSEDTVIALKEAEATYGALTPSAKVLVPEKTYKALEVMKEKISAVKTEENKGNKAVVYNGTIPWDVVMEVSRISQTEDSYATLRDALGTKKDASVLKVFHVTAYQIMEDGTHVKFQPAGGMSLTLHAGEDLTGESVVIAHLMEDGTIEYLEGEISGDYFTFTTKSLSTFAAGTINKDADPSENQDDGAGGDDTKDKNKGNDNQSGSGNKTASGSGTNKSTNTGGKGGVPKTGDMIDVQTEIMKVVILSGVCLLLIALKKKREQEV